MSDYLRRDYPQEVLTLSAYKIVSVTKHLAHYSVYVVALGFGGISRFAGPFKVSGKLCASAWPIWLHSFSGLFTALFLFTLRVNRRLKSASRMIRQSPPTCDHIMVSRLVFGMPRLR